MNILPRRRGPSNFIIDSIAYHSKAVRDAFHYLEVDLAGRPYVDQDDVDQILKLITEARARFDCIETELSSPASRARQTKPAHGVPISGGIVGWGDTIPAVEASTPSVGSTA